MLIFHVIAMFEIQTLNARQYSKDGRPSDGGIGRARCSSRTVQPCSYRYRQTGHGAGRCGHHCRRYADGSCRTSSACGECRISGQCLATKGPVPFYYRFFGWGGKTVETLAGMVPNLKVEVLEPVLCKGMPDQTAFSALERLADAIAQKQRENGFQ